MTVYCRVIGFGGNGAVQTYTVIYWRAGAWHRMASLPCRFVAREQARLIQERGHPAEVYATATLDTVGVPAGPPGWWDFARMRRRDFAARIF